MHCLLKSLSGGFAPPAALANFRSVFHSGLSLFKQLLFLHFELEFAATFMQVTDEIYKSVYRYWTFGLLYRHVWPNEELVRPNVEAINRCLKGQKSPFTRSLTTFYHLKSGF
jgi:hypothetical protein